MACLLALSTVLLACADTLPSTPDTVTVSESAAIAPAAASPLALSGCANFVVRLGNRAEIAVEPTARECGPIRPVINGVAHYDRTTGMIRLPIALENAGEEPVEPAAFLFGWQDSIKVLAPPGLAINKRTGAYLELLSPDSVIPDSAEAFAGALAWRYANVLAPDNAEPILEPGDRSEFRWIELRLHDGVQEFRVTFYARAQRAQRAQAPVPPIPPDHMSVDLLFDPENMISPLPCMTGRHPRDIILLIFERGATQEQKQAAVDAVKGTVIGGDRVLGEYYIRVADDGTGEPLCEAVNLLEELPQVEIAGPAVIFLSNLFVKPVDGRRLLHPLIRPRAERLCGFERSVPGARRRVRRCAGPRGFGI